MKAVLYSSDLKRLIDATKKFTKPDGSKMQYIHLVADKDSMIITATALDGYKISIEKATLIDCDESFDCLIKPSTLKYKEAKCAGIERVDNKAYIFIGDNITGYVQPEGEYYKTSDITKQIESTEVIQTIGVSAKLLKEALESVKTDRRSCVMIDVPKDPNGLIIIRHKGNKKAVLPVRVSNDDN